MTLTLKLVVVFAIVLPAAACAPTLHGRLHGPDGEVVAGPEARVNIARLSGDAGGGGVTVIADVDAGGAFATHAELPEGEYLVEALVPGYALASRRVRLGETDGIELTLTPTAPATTEAVRANPVLDAARGGGGATLTPPSL